jgi:hypothetical protein
MPPTGEIVALSNPRNGGAGEGLVCAISNGLSLVHSLGRRVLYLTYKPSHASSPCLPPFVQTSGAENSHTNDACAPLRNSHCTVRTMSRCDPT